MRKVFIIILSIQILTSGQFLNELMKFRNLIAHFQEHQQDGSIVDFAHFIRLHYFDPRHESTDPQNHNSLPLHQTSVCMNFVFHSTVEELTLSYPVVQTSQKYRSTTKEYFPQFNHSVILQPPRKVA